MEVADMEWETIDEEPGLAEIVLLVSVEPVETLLQQRTRANIPGQD